MIFAYLFIDAVFDILSTSLFQHFESALLVVAVVSFTFSFISSVLSDWGDCD